MAASFTAVVLYHLCVFVCVSVWLWLCMGMWCAGRMAPFELTAAENFSFTYDNDDGPKTRVTWTRRLVALVYYSIILCIIYLAACGYCYLLFYWVFGARCWAKLLMRRRLTEMNEWTRVHCPHFFPIVYSPALLPLYECKVKVVFAHTTQYTHTHMTDSRTICFMEIIYCDSIEQYACTRTALPIWTNWFTVLFIYAVSLHFAYHFPIIMTSFILHGHWSVWLFIDFGTILALAPRWCVLGLRRGFVDGPKVISSEFVADFDRWRVPHIHSWVFIMNSIRKRQRLIVHRN